MNSILLIISVVLTLISTGSLSMFKLPKTYQNIIITLLLVSIISSIYFGIILLSGSEESRMTYANYNATNGMVEGVVSDYGQVQNATEIAADKTALWGTDFSQTLADPTIGRPTYLKTVPAITTASKPSDVDKAWIKWVITQNSIVGSATGVTDEDIKSILVRKVDNTIAEIPIMKLFEKIYEDSMMGFYKSKAEIKRAVKQLNEGQQYEGIPNKLVVRGVRYYFGQEPNERLGSTDWIGPAGGGGQGWATKLELNGGQTWQFML